jgi:RNA polymerase sigma factor (sigma-70 family)
MAEKRAFTDADFLEGLRNNNNETLKALYKKFFTVVLKHVVNNSGSEQEAKDVYQESIIVLYQNVQKPAFELNCQLQTYIFSIAKRIWLKQISKQSHLVKLGDNESGEDEVNVMDEVSDYERREKEFDRMNESLEQLGEPCKSLITDFYLSKLNMEEIAEKFGYTNSDNAKNQKYKCLQRLKKIFSNE